MTRSPLVNEVRGRIPWVWLPAVAAVTALLSYVLHHTLPGHGVLVAAIVVVLWVVAAVGTGLLIRPAERLLPVVVTAGESEVDVRAAGAEHAGFCAALHGETLDLGFLASLGHGFLRVYHAAYVDSPFGLSYVALADETPIGMVVGTVDARAHRRWVLRRRGVRLAASALTALAGRPAVTARFLRTRLGRYRRSWQANRGGQATAATPGGPVATLDHLAVVPGAQGAGIGGRLTARLVEATRAAGAARVDLVTRADASGAEEFYSRRGWQAVRTTTPGDGPAMTYMSLRYEDAPCA